MTTRGLNRMARYLTVAVALLPAGSAVAAPTLSAEMIRDLTSTQRQLEQGQSGQGDHTAVIKHARSQAQRLAGGNDSDRWARGLYLQLSASAMARSGDVAGAADLLAEARHIRGIRRLDSAQVDRWQRQEAGLRRQSGDNGQARELLGDWLARHAGSANDHWLMAKLLADDEQWAEAASRVEQALEKDAQPDEAQSAFAAAVLQRAGDSSRALTLVEVQLEQAGNDATEWRRAAGLAQQLGDAGRAAAIWEAGWQGGVLSGSEDLEQRIRLHRAGGTPARAAELLAEALEAGSLPPTSDHLRWLAESWQAARDHDRALAAWKALAEQTHQVGDWLELGQLAYSWGEWKQARHALEQARSLGAADAADWLSNLPPRE